ncbi:GNAT family N-acetyltransferase [Brevibacillus ginsengisoli]|uniref:GNAT family N-acetyltransferase n=1 Tax=Brevibacillus ginsengisoli TaxID=363854 RepID=UPI003CF42525
MKLDFINFEIKTDRLILRPYNHEDYPNWYQQFDHRLPSQHKYDDGRPSNMFTYTEEWFTNRINGYNQSAKEDKMYNLGIFRQDDGVNVGKIEVFTILRMDYHWGMMGYSIHNQFWRKGYGRESVVAATEGFFTDFNFHRIELHINTDNHPSILLAEKAGFNFECERKAFSYENDKWTDFLIYHKNRGDK